MSAVDRMLEKMSIADLDVVIKISIAGIKSGTDAKYWTYIGTKANHKLGDRLIPLMGNAKKEVGK